MTKIEQLQLQQLNHDKEYHKDIYFQSTIFKLKHFTLHYSKYLSRLVLHNHSESEVKKVLLDSFIISLSFFNTLNSTLEDLSLEVLKEFSQIHFHKDIILNIYAQGLLSISKGLDNYDHFDDYNKEDLLIGAQTIISLIISYINITSWTTFESDLLLRYQNIRNKKLV